MNPKALVASLCVVNLTVGLAAGVAVDRALLPCHDRQEVRSAKPGDRHGGKRGKRGKRGRRGMKERMERRLQHLTERLELDAEQVPRVRAVFEARRPKFMAVFSEVRPRLEALERETHAELSALLRPEQQAKLEEMRRQFESRRPWSRKK